jgi:hypothetical protein
VNLLWTSTYDFTTQDWSEALEASSIYTFRCRSWTPGLRLATAPSLKAEFPEVRKPSACACDLKSTPGVTGQSRLHLCPFQAALWWLTTVNHDQLRGEHRPLGKDTGVYDLPQL